MKNKTLERKLRRQKRVRMMIMGTKERPRISVFRSNKYIYGQAINDQDQKTIASMSSLNLKKEKKVKKSEEAKIIGTELGKLLHKKKIEVAVFDRGSYSYKGRVQQFCDGLREAGIKI